MISTYLVSMLHEYYVTFVAVGLKSVLMTKHICNVSANKFDLLVRVPSHFNSGCYFNSCFDWFSFLKCILNQFWNIYSNCGCSFNNGCNSSHLPNARHQMWVSRVFRDHIIYLYHMCGVYCPCDKPIVYYEKKIGEI